MKAVTLAGGFGTRLSEKAALRPIRTLVFVIGKHIDCNLMASVTPDVCLKRPK